MKIRYNVPSRTSETIKIAYGCYATCCKNANTGSNDVYRTWQDN